MVLTSRPLADNTPQGGTMLVPFGKPRKVSGYHAPSGPKSEGRMKNTTKAGKQMDGQTASTLFENKPADPFHGSAEKHSYGLDDSVGNYKRHPRETN